MDWVLIIHLLCVMGWMTSIFAVPRALIYWKRAAAGGDATQIGELTYRLYRFSSGLGLIAALTGFWMAWSIWSFAPWTHLKITLVALLAAHYVYTGLMVGRAKRGEFRESDLFLRIFNEVSVIGVIAILWVVVVKPF